MLIMHSMAHAMTVIVILNGNSTFEQVSSTAFTTVFVQMYRNLAFQSSSSAAP